MILRHYNSKIQKTNIFRSLLRIKNVNECSTARYSKFYGLRNFYNCVKK